MKKALRKGIALFLASLAGAFSLFACKDKPDEGEISVYAPDGAPALALAQVMAEDTAEDGVSYRIVPPSLIATKVSAKEESKNADLCVLPITAASKLLGKGERYQMLGTLTHGNLYLIAKEGKIEDLSALVGKTVGVLQINEVPGLTFKATILKAGLSYNELKNGENPVADKINLRAISGAGDVGAVEADCYLLAEPAVSAQKSKGYSIAGDLQKLYGGEKGYPQAVLVGKKSVIERRSAWVKSFVEKVENGGEWLKNASGQTLVSVVSAHLEDKEVETSLKAPLLTAEVVGRCGIYFTYAENTVEEVEEFLTDLLAVNDKAGSIPSQGFYWRR